jgi:putative phosphoribosyl transferase
MFIDRRDAGRQLAAALAYLAQRSPVILALPRGGLPLGREIADALDAPLDILIVRKLGVPSNPEFAFGAVGEGNTVVLDEETMALLGVSAVTRDRLITEAQTEIDRRVETYRGGLPLMDFQGRTVIIVDDGLATGATAEAGIRVARGLGAATVILAVPTGSAQAIARLSELCDDLVCLETPGWFGSVGSQYRSFPQVTDAQVISLLGR